MISPAERANFFFHPSSRSHAGRDAGGPRPGRFFTCSVLAAALLAFPCFAGVRITEFLAQNDGGLRDADGDSMDWIELLNDSAAPVNLAGWHLTDSTTNLVKWTFPATNFAAGTYMVVFASGKDRAVAGAELHTSFLLNQGGGYLALVQPDGSTIAQSFNYPAQRANVSSGRAQQIVSTTILATGAAARVYVPSNDAIGLAWTARVFDDSGWLATNLPARFLIGATTNTLLAVDFNERAQDPAATTQAGFQSFIINSNTSETAVQTLPTARVFGAITITVSNASTAAYDDRLRATPGNSGGFTESLVLRDFIFSTDGTGTGGFDVMASGITPNHLYRLTVWSYDSGSANNRISDWSANGVVVTNGYTFNGSTLPTSNERFRFSFDTTSDGSGRILLSGRRNPASLAASAAVFLNALQIGELTSIPPTNGLAALMVSNTASAWIRVPFNIANPAALSPLTLRIRYDDGFVAYINGQIVASRNAPGALFWNSAATGAHSDAVAEDIPLSLAPGLLVAGVNVLAIQGLNVNAADPDFTIAPELLSQQSTDLGDRYFLPPTPGTNNDAGYTGLVADTKFSVNRGFYSGPFALSITCATAGAEIRFTTNGSVPTPANGSVFTAPFMVTGQSFIRAAAFKPGLVPSDVDTHSYIFLRDVLRQSNNIPNYPTIWQASYPADYEMDSNIVKHPSYGTTLSNDMRGLKSLCIVADQNGLWNSSTGIYPNPTSIGTAWERPASLELISSNSHTEFAVTCKIQIHGNASRDNVRTPKHSIGIGFNSDYGPTKLHYDWFGGGVDAHDGIVLRSCGFVDGWSGRYADNGTYTSSETGESFRGLRYRPETTCYLRDVWVKDSYRAMGWVSSRSAFVHLYINGLYWGLYEPSERIDASYCSLHLGGPEGAWDVLVGNDAGAAPDVVDGSLADWQTVLNLAAAGVASEPAYQAIAQAVDLDSLIDYMLLHIFAESEDWPHHNWYVAHRRATNGLPATKFICTVWDQELSLDRLVRRNRVDAGNLSNGEQYSPARVYSQLRSWPEFRRQFGDRVHKHLFNDGALTTSNNVTRLLQEAALVRGGINGESARWGDARKTGVPAGQIGTGVTFTRDEWWQPEIDKLATNFLQKLTADNVARFRAGSLYPSVGAPAFGQFGGGVPAGYGLVMSHTNGSGIIYFTTDLADPRVYGTGNVAPSAQAYAAPVTINATTLVRARVLRAGIWSALVEAVFYPPQDLSKLALTEIMYNPPAIGATNGDEFEFVEIKNTGTNTLNLSGLTFTGISFVFTNGTMLGSGEFFVLARNPAAFASRHPGVLVNGVYSGGLNNSGETLTLSHPLGPTVFSVTYDDEAPWPAAADNFGFSLVPKNPGASQAPENGASWRASTNPGGSPGADDPVSSIPSIRINEVLTASVLPDVDRIELFNPTDASVNMGGWFLTDDHTIPQKFRIPDGTTISAGGFVLFTEAQFNSMPGLPGSFSLSSQGESVYLFSADAAGNLTGYSHGFAFDAAEAGVSFGRYVNSVGEEQFPAQLSMTMPGVNSGPLVGPVVISEIHYHPAPGGDEFIELENITAAAVPLFDPAHGTNVWRLNGLAYDFPTNITLNAGARLLLVGTNPASFRIRYGVPTNVAILGPYLGELQDSGERLRLERPDVPTTNGVAYITVDEVRFNDKAPWPPVADGSGPSLQRIQSSAYGNDPLNWSAAGPTPGQPLTAADTDGDGIPDVWELAYGTSPFVNDAQDDPDGDGQTNLQEYFAGTDPMNPDSFLQVDQIALEGGAMVLQFRAVSNRTYAVVAGNLPDTGTWTNVATIAAQPITATIRITNSIYGNSRFFRLVTPSP